ncbi:flavodoxin [uncultured Ellagibacter sp.]|uniref:flavodoxin n=1 Tax=uncultured Ellagibacter sp. TaxID=2137580 RepID=UPI0026095B78|nr:flavodoxin [uncultured Ellagibacter sp.]
MNTLTRRRFLQITGLSTLGAATGLAGCSESRNATDASISASASSGGTPSGDATSKPSTSAAPAASSGTSLVLVFSRAGENYGVGTVEVGNTMVLARMIAEKTGADLFEIERAEPYPDAYDACCDEAVDEKNSGARPELAEMPNLSGYDTVYLGFPCWWGDMPMPVYTAIEALDWGGKTICPFNTHAGSGEAGMFATVARKCAGATVTSGLTMSGTTAQNDRNTAESQIDNWLASLS